MLKRSALAALVLASSSSAAFAQENFGAQSMNNEKSDVTPEQRRRAEKAVALIKANRCEEAYNMALDQQDTRLAGNIAVACKARFRQ